MSFIAYDIAFLVLFTIATVLFLSKRKENLKRQGWMFLYHTKVGLKYMDVLAKKHSKILKPLQYLVIACGYVLLITMSVLLVQTAYNYISSPYLAKAIKIPPLLPLFPYFPQIFKIESLFPPFYFTYFLVALAIVALSHEFAHGLFARLNNIRIKSTGLAFFGPFFGAFVEQDDRDMNKAKKVPQLAVLAAGTFANIIMTIIFGLVLWGFFAASFAPAGVNFNTYSSAVINTSQINSVNGISITSSSQIPDLLNESLTRITIGNTVYFAVPASLNASVKQHVELITAYEDTPALEAQLGSPILAFNGKQVTGLDELRQDISSRSPGEEVTIRVLKDNVKEDVKLKLAERDGKAYLGIGVISPSASGIGGIIRTVVYKVKDPFIYYEPRWGGEFAWFIYYMLWWIVMINILVALFNMLPLGMLDGGRFFYLTIWGLTGKEKWGKRAFAIATWFIIALLALMMVRWIFLFF